jgi:hypothetical protein
MKSVPSLMTAAFPFQVRGFSYISGSPPVFCQTHVLYPCTKGG